MSNAIVLISPIIRFVKSLDIAYKYANQTLLNLLLKDQQLIERLR